MRALRLVLALTVALMLPMLSATAAHALGEDGPFELPLARDTVTIAPGVVNRIPLSSLIDDDEESGLQLDTARLAVPDKASASQLDGMTLASDGTSLTVDGEGTWTVQDESLVYTPASETEDAPAPIAITIEARNGIRSLASDLPVKPSDVTEAEVAAPAGQQVQMQLNGGLRPDGTARVRLLLDTMPAGSTLSDDGRRLIAADEGEWQLSADGTSLVFTPSSSHLGRSPEPIRFVTQGEDGTTLGTGIVTLSTPVLTDLVRASGYGDPVDFEIGDGAQGIDPETLRLVPLSSADAGSESASDSGSSAQDSGDDAAAGGPGKKAGRAGAAEDTAAEVDRDGTHAKVAGQGEWTLDRSSRSVRFTPSDDAVTEADPMGITAEDDQGNTAGVATLTPGYPAMLDQTQVASTGGTMTFTPMDDAHFVRADSLRFSDKGLARGASLAANGRELTIPGQGTWSIDLDDRTVTFAPAEGAENGLRSHVQISGDGSYADGTTTNSTMTAVVSDSGAIMRDDELKTSPGKPVQVDLLANDTAGSPSDPLAPATVRISSLDASDIDELDRYSGTHLVVPGEGEYRVGSDGVLHFDPAEGFRGRASAISYTVQDADGIRYRANVAVHVDPQLASSSDPRGDSSAGINTMLAGLMPSAASTSAVFLTIVVLIGFAGVISLFIGSRMEADRRTWKD